MPVVAMTREMGSLGSAIAREAARRLGYEFLRDDILRSKTTHPDPWGYTAKARGWGQRAQALVDELASRGDSAQLERSVEALTAEVSGDRDFQAARRLF